MKKAEIILVIIAIICIILSLIPLPGGNILTVLSLTFLSCLYFYFGFALFNGIRFRDIFKKTSYQGIGPLRIIGGVVAGMAASIVIMGMLFRFMLWAGGSVMLLIGCFILFLLLIVAMVKFNSGSLLYRNIFKRAMPLTILGVAVFYLPGSQWQQIRYRSHPEYVKALRDLDREPDNKEYQERVEEEEAKFRQMAGEE